MKFLNDRNTNEIPFQPFFKYVYIATHFIFDYFFRTNY